MFQKIAIVGLGLIGGSFVKLIKKYHPNINVYAVNRSQGPIEKAVKENLIVSGGQEVSCLPKDCELVFICSPINLINFYIEEVAKHCDENVVITDIASIKQGIGNNVVLKKNQLLIPGHPMAGTEKQGFDNSFLEMLEGAKYIVTADSSDRVNHFVDFLRSMTFNPIFLKDGEHDLLMAYASHFPYLMAQLTIDVSRDVDQNALKQVFGPGFRDTSRVASSPVQWALDVSKHNKDNLLKALASLKHSIEEYEQLLQENDEEKLNNKFTSIKQYRDQFFEGDKT